MLEDQIFCRAFWNGLMVQTDGTIWPCCMGGESIGSLQDGLENVWKGPKIQKLRKEVLEGKIPDICKRCLEYEKTSGASLRLSHNLLPVSLEDPKVVSIDFRMTNTCNFACCMCGPWASSRWEKEEKDLGWKSIPLEEVEKEKLYEFIRQHAKHLKKVNLAGGEPTIMPEMYKLLDILKSENAVDLEISCAINCSSLKYQDQSFLEALEPFTRVNLLLSIDAVGEAAESLRYGCNWKKTDSIVRTIIKTATPNVRVVFHPTISILNILEIPNLFRYINTLQQETARHLYIQGGNLLSTPSEYCLVNLPSNLKVQISTILQQEREGLTAEELNYLQQYVEFMNSQEGVVDLYFQGLKKLKELDCRRNTKALSFLPQ